MDFGEIMQVLGSIYGVVGSFGAAIVSVILHKILGSLFGERSLPAGFFFLLTLLAVLAFILSLIFLVVNILLRGWAFVTSR